MPTRLTSCGMLRPVDQRICQLKSNGIPWTVSGRAAPRSSCREIHVSGHASSVTQHMENCTQPGDTILLVPAPILVHDGRPDFGCIKDDGGSVACKQIRERSPRSCRLCAHSGLAVQDQLDSAVPGLNSTSLLVCSDMLHAYLLSQTGIVCCTVESMTMRFDDQADIEHALVEHGKQQQRKSVPKKSCEKPSLRALAAGVCVAVRRLDIDSGVSCSMQ